MGVVRISLLSRELSGGERQSINSPTRPGVVGLIVRS